MELIQSIDRQLGPALKAGKLVADSAGAAFAPLEEPDAARVKPHPKHFVAPMTLREIKKKLREDPDYYDKWKRGCMYRRRISSIDSMFVTIIIEMFNELNVIISRIIIYIEVFYNF